MRNLRCIRQSRISVNGPLARVAWSANQKFGDIICAVGPTNGKTPTIELRHYSNNGMTYPDYQIPATSNGEQSESGQNGSIIAAWDAPCPLPDLPNDEILLLEDLGSIISVVLAGGDIIVVRPNPAYEEEKIEIVGSVDVGITAARWSFDQSLLAVTTRADTFLLMTASYDSIASYSFKEEDAKLSKQVSVGWGKAETQFKGKRAKALRDPTVPETVDQGTLSPFDDRRVTISWRGDGELVAVNSLLVHNGRRIIRVFTRDGALDSVSEPVNGLEAAISWRPDGMLLCGIQRLETSVKVVFFERNGLRHGEFCLRPRHGDDCLKSPIELHWNKDSSILAICFLNRVQLWTMSNYHYYLKQEILAQAGAAPFKALLVDWHNTDPASIVIYGSEGDPHKVACLEQQVLRTVLITRYTSVVTRRSTGLLSDTGLQAVIDGCTLKITPLALANVPPPMASHTISVGEPIIDVGIDEKNQQIAVLQPNQVSIFQCDRDALHRSKPTFVESVEFSFDATDVHPYQIVHDGRQDYFLLLSDFKSGNYTLRSMRTKELKARLSCQDTVSLANPIHDAGLCVLAGLDVFKFDDCPEPGDLESSMRLICSFPELVNDSFVVKHDGKTIAFGLSTSGKLFANDLLLVSNCTSFAVTRSHLILTTANHYMKFVRLSSNVFALQVPPDQVEADERCRSIERGAKLVAAMPSTFSIVLQMPRGNLETIYPRALVVAGIRQNIDRLEYDKAFLACRSHRVDMNILYDFAPQQFLQNVPLLLDQLKKVEHIDLFLSQLRNEDVTQSLYREAIPQQDTKHENTHGVLANGVTPAKDEPGSKINIICDAFLKSLVRRYSTNLQNVITAYLCKTPPAIEDGLRVIISLNESQPDLVDRAVEHICFLADVNRIYEAALGLYDLQLALLVAQQSQKDPKEYLPYLQGLQDASPLRRRFRIDDDLGRRCMAVKSLHSSDAHDEVKRYVEKHQLYKEALELYRYDQPHQTTILRSYAEYLSSCNRYKEAGIAFESLSDYHLASNAYLAINLWRECLSCAQLAQLSSPEITNLAHSLATALAESKDYYAIAIINLDYLSDFPACLQALCKGCHFAEATRLAASNQRPDLLEAIIDPGLIEASASLTELLADCKAQLGSQVPRLHDLRVKKAADPLAFLEGAAVDGEAGDIPDNVSLAPSDSSTTGGTLLTQYTKRTNTGTLASNATRRTSKNRRREERKRARGKKGSVYEEEYLVNSVGRLIERINSVGEEVMRTVEGCLKRGMRERAMAVESAMVEVVERCQGCVNEVWEVQDVQRTGTMQRTDAVVRDESAWGADDVYRDSIESWKRTGPPAVKTYERSSLL